MSHLKYMATDLNSDQINDWFKISGPKINIDIIPQSKLGGKLLDPSTGGPAVVAHRQVLPSYKRHLGSSDADQRAYAEPIRQEEEESFARQISRMGHHQGNWNSADDGTSSMTSGIENVHDTISTVATLVDEHSNAVLLPAGMTEDDAVKIYQQYNTRHNYDPNLPITQCREDIVSLIESQQVTVIQGETGSGKTTQVAQYIFDNYASNNRYCNIVVTQPRRIAAISIARRVCAERGWQLGRVCGYQIGMEREASEDTRLLYCTTGVLLQKLIAEKHMHHFTHVILDEVHERDQESDFCLLVVKKLLRKNSRDVKVVLMSATIDSDLFAGYFSRPVGGKLEKAPVYKVQGQIYDVADYYLEDMAELGTFPRLEASAPAVAPEAIDIAVKLILSFDDIEQKNNQAAPGRGSVLVFLPGLDEISRMDSKLRPLIHNHNMLILPLHSSITCEEQVRVFDRPIAGVRKVILSTNIAESSITVPDVRYVIDFCLTKMEVCDPETNYSSLQLQWASKANCKQRRGRAGRVARGRVYRLVTHKFWMEDLPDYGIPEMQRSSLSQLILKVKMLDLGEPKAILALALSPPRLDDIERTIVLLKEAGALASLQYGEVNPHDGELTFLGKVLASLPVDIHLSKLMMLGYVFGVLEETIIISAAHSLNSFFARPFKAELEAYKHKLAWATDTFSDSLCHLHAFQAWSRQVEIGAFRSHADEAKWGKENYIQIRQIKLVAKLVEDLTKRLKNLNVYKIRQRSQQTTTSNSATDEIILKIVLCGAFYPNYFEEVPSDERLADREMSGYNPFTTVMVKGLPQNQGHLYRADLEDLFTVCDGRRAPRIHFEETRAFIEFYKDPVDTSANKVQLAVYVALKMRHNRSVPLQITLHDSQMATQLMSAFSTKQDGHKLRSHLVDENRASGPQQVPPPSSHTSHMSILIGKVVSFGRFWAYAADAASERKMAQMHIHLQQFVNSQLYSAPSSRSHNYQIGDYCLAPYAEDGQKLYFRARIEKLQRNIATVFFVDYGNTSDANVQELCEIRPDFYKLPFQAFECELCQLKPSPIKCPSGQWTPEAQNRFQQFVDTAKVFCIKVFSVVHDVVRVELIANINDCEVNINSELIRMNYADIAEESYLSIQNHDKREQESFSQRPQACSSMMRNLPVSINEAAHHARNRSAANNCQRFGERLTLKGPWNSYEIGFAGCTFSSKRRPVRVERESINSVAVNGELRFGANEVKTASRMLIAASVTLNPNGGSLTARNTTLMPPIPGLLTLVSLTFAPSAELRIDKDKTRYTGALCGLGWDTSSYEGDSAYPDHDMEIISDFDFTIADLKMINSVRMAINLALTGEYGPETVENLQKKAREQLLKLIETKRTPITPTPYYNQYRWRQVDPDDIIPPSVEPMRLGTVLYNLHAGVVLNELLQEHEDESSASQTHSSATSGSEMNTQQKKAHNNWLKSKACKSTKPENIRCRLCNRILHTPYELMVHLTSLMHRQNSA